MPDSDIQRCVVHLQRDLLSKVRPKDKAEFSRDIKEAFNNFDKSSSQELAQEKLRLLASKWERSYDRVVNQLTEEEFILDYWTYICYPVEVRGQIYTTNGLEKLNRQIRRVTKSKVSFDKKELVRGLPDSSGSAFHFMNHFLKSSPQGDFLEIIIQY